MKYWKDNQNGVLLWGTGSVVTGEEITYEEYLELQTAFEARQKAIADYTEKVKAGEITLEEVPTEYLEEVTANVNVEEPIDERQALVNEIIAEVNK